MTKMLICVDSSYWYYFSLFGCFKEWQKKYPNDVECWIKDPKDTDQQNLPDLTNCQSFKKVLKQFVMKRLESIDYYSRQCFKEQIEESNQIDIVFAMDSSLKKNFRKDLYPAYKAQREIAPKAFCNWKIREYVFNVLFKELEVEEKYGYKFIQVDGAEGDDIIATLFNKCSNDYSYKVLIASDHDFVQLENVSQIDMIGRNIKCELGGEKVTPKEYLLGKILLGDSADNITKVFKGVGPKKALKLIRNKNKLKQMLNENQDSAKQFLLNKKLISFDEIPKNLQDEIVEKINVSLYKETKINKMKFENINWL